MLPNGRDVDEDWTVPAQIHVLLVDGEMPHDDTKSRLQGLGANKEFLHLLHHQVLFDRQGLEMNLTNLEVQDILTKLCEHTGTKLLVLDTSSSLFRGLDELDGKDWEKVLPWLLGLARRRIAVLIVLHAGRDPSHPRGNTRREDNAAWIINVIDRSEDHPGEKGAHFETEFAKWRTREGRPLNRKWSVVTEPDGAITYRCDQLCFDEKVLSKIQAGLRTATEIADELKVSKSTVSKAAARLEQGNLIEKKGDNRYTTYEPRRRPK